jgi:hypothetical protein
LITMRSRSGTMTSIARRVIYSLYSFTFVVRTQCVTNIRPGASPQARAYARKRQTNSRVTCKDSHGKNLIRTNHAIYESATD